MDATKSQLAVPLHLSIPILCFVGSQTESQPSLGYAYGLQCTNQGV